MTTSATTALTAEAKVENKPYTFAIANAFIASSKKIDNVALRTVVRIGMVLAYVLAAAFDVAFTAASHANNYFKNRTVTVETAKPLKEKEKALKETLKIAGRVVSDAKAVQKEFAKDGTGLAARFEDKIEQARSDLVQAVRNLDAASILDANKQFVRTIEEALEGETITLQGKNQAKGSYPLDRLVFKGFHTSNAEEAVRGLLNPQEIDTDFDTGLLYSNEEMTALVGKKMGAEYAEALANRDTKATEKLDDLVRATRSDRLIDSEQIDKFVAEGIAETVKQRFLSDAGMDLSLARQVLKESLSTAFEDGYLTKKGVAGVRAAIQKQNRNPNKGFENLVNGAVAQLGATGEAQIAPLANALVKEGIITPQTATQFTEATRAIIHTAAEVKAKADAEKAEAEAKKAAEEKLARQTKVAQQFIANVQGAVAKRKARNQRVAGYGTDFVLKTKAAVQTRKLAAEEARAAAVQAASDDLNGILAELKKEQEPQLIGYGAFITGLDELAQLKKALEQVNAGTKVTVEFDFSTPKSVREGEESVKRLFLDKNGVPKTKAQLELDIRKAEDALRLAVFNLSKRADKIREITDRYIDKELAYKKQVPEFVLRSSLDRETSLNASAILDIEVREDVQKAFEVYAQKPPRSTAEILASLPGKPATTAEEAVEQYQQTRVARGLPRTVPAPVATPAPAAAAPQKSRFAGVGSAVLDALDASAERAPQQGMMSKLWARVPSMRMPALFSGKGAPVLEEVQADAIEV